MSKTIIKGKTFLPAVRVWVKGPNHSFAHEWHPVTGMEPQRTAAGARVVAEAWARGEMRRDQKNPDAVAATHLQAGALTEQVTTTLVFAS